MAAKKKSSKGSRSTDKKAFILGLPGSLKASEVVKRARSAGISISENYVYVARRDSSSSKTGVEPVARAPHGASKPEELFTQLAIDLGLGRAAELLDAVRRRAHSLAT